MMNVRTTPAACLELCDRQERIDAAYHLCVRVAQPPAIVIRDVLSRLCMTCAFCFFDW